MAAISISTEARNSCNKGEGGGAILEDSAEILRLDPISSVYCCDYYSMLGD